ncbi:MAG: hypothetical protein QUV35_15140 [Hydrogenophaga sp.]|uniref:hypothetical protein n=1 Tax=Hydrogenophaga sp. TaxID=1904254 RepID=UPI0026095E27|nr:hypothetical protein [Hydrogenophaga sp.]MDM7943957.1 hypothetical protein [Hydrogenophaga sp.]
MTTKIRQTFLLWHAADGEQLQYIVDRGGRSDEGNCEKLHSLKKPATPVSTQLLLEDDRLITLPFNDFAWILPNRTGVLVIFKPGSYTHPDGNDIFPCPNNAAIYNADGSLRCQVRFASGPERSAPYVIDRTFTRTITHQTLPIGRRGDPIDPPIVQFGVLVGTREHPPESFYVLNTETGELTNGLFSVPY